jgi:hypothetical protein
MPRTPEVCQAAFCPSHFLEIASRVLHVLPLRLRSALDRLPSAVFRSPLIFSVFSLVLLLITHHSSLMTVQAQSATATLSGTVTDQNSAVIPDVSISVINIAQGFQRSATTNGEGAFIVPLLPPGNYTVKAEHQGFTPTEVRDVVLNVNDNVAMKIHMSVGTVSQTVQIVEGLSLINESPAVATVVDRQFVGNLPLNGRSFQSLITLTPGVVLTKATSAEQGQFSINGQRADANYFTIDGVSANVGIRTSLGLSQSAGGALPGLSASGGTNNLVSVDALQEFKIQTSTYAPEFGRTPGGQIQILTRSGTNDFHGTLFEYFRNDVLDSNDWFANQKGLKKPPLRQNDFGGVIGGPILLPRFGEGGHQPWYNGLNKTFFFFSYEALRLRQPLVGITDVPSLAARQATAQMLPYLNAYPLPTGPTTGNGIAEFSASFSNPSSLDATSIRLDQTFGDKVTLFGRYNYAPSETVQRAVSSLSLNTLSSTHLDIQTLTVGSTMSITPTISNDLRINFSKVKGSNFFELDTLGGAIVPSDASFFPPSFSHQNALFTLALNAGRNSGIQIGKNVANLQRQINLVDNLSLTKGAHQLKVGLDYRRLSPFFGPRPYSQSIQFSAVVGAGGVAAPGTALSAKANSVTNFANDSITVFFTNFSAYGQDTWRVGRRLTLTYGLRWELNPPPSGDKGLATVTGLENPATLTLSPLGTPLYKTTYNNLAPRLGVVYQLSQRPGRETVLRGGFGIFYDLGTGALGDAVISFPYNRTLSLPSLTPFPLDPSQAVPPPFSLTLPTAGVVIRTIDPNIALPRTYQWNVAVEQSLGANQTVSASYVAALGRRLLRQEQLTRPNLSFSNVLVTRNSATSDYHAMQLQFQRRLSRGLQALASYTWSHSIDIYSNDSTLIFPNDKINPRVDRGSSDFDVRHALTGAVTYNIPAPRLGTVGKAILRDFSVDTTFVARSATPVNVASQNVSLFGVFSLVRPDLISGIPLYIADPLVAGGERINPAAFSTSFTGRQGTLGRNTLRGFSIYQIDLALRRQINLTEKWKLQLRAEFFNIFNHPNFADPSGNLSNAASFGRSPTMLNRSLGSGGLSGGFNPLYQIGGPRSIQLALKLQF